MESNCKQPLSIGKINALNGCVGDFLGPPHGTNQKNSKSTFSMNSNI